jgi:hypothetical protein
VTSAQLESWRTDDDTDVFNGKITLLEDMPAPPPGEE